VDVVSIERAKAMTDGTQTAAEDTVPMPALRRLSAAQQA
jgi:hypothetical protein